MTLWNLGKPLMGQNSFFYIIGSCHYLAPQVCSSLCSTQSVQAATVQTERGQKQEECSSYCYCTTVGKNAHSRKSPTSCLQPPDSSEAAVLIPDWLGSLSGLEHGRKSRPIRRREEERRGEKRRGEERRGKERRSEERRGEV